MNWLYKWTLAGAAGLLVLLTASPAPALSYVGLLEDYNARYPYARPYVQSVDIDVYYTVHDRQTGQEKWVKHTLYNQRDLSAASALVRKLQAERRTVMIGWRRSAAVGGQLSPPASAPKPVASPGAAGTPQASRSFVASSRPVPPLQGTGKFENMRQFETRAQADEYARYLAPRGVETKI